MPDTMESANYRDERQGCPQHESHGSQDFDEVFFRAGLGMQGYFLMPQQETNRGQPFYLQLSALLA